MKLSFAVPVLLAASIAAFAQSMPRMTTVDPGNGKIGDEVTITGENLEKSNVAKVYFTDGKSDLLLDITSQTPTTIKFRIPAKMTTGRFALELLTTGKEPKLIEQPVKFTVEE
ncbi:MAG: IPT/TIG domain-containing protein [Bryobacteraceae bacterium]